MESVKCICTSSSATEKNKLTINDLDDDSLGIIFNKLPYIDRSRIENVCERWSDVSKASWCTYSKRLRIGEDPAGDFVPSYYNNITEKKNILENILQQSGPYLEEITFQKDDVFCRQFPMGTINWISKFCPKLKRLSTGLLMLNDDDWWACNDLETFSFTPVNEQQQVNLDVYIGSNKRLRRLEIFGAFWLTAGDFDDLDPGQLQFLQIEYCSQFIITPKIAKKLADSLVELCYSTIFCFERTLTQLGKLKNLRSLQIKVKVEWTMTEFIADISRNCRKLERLFLAIRLHRTRYDLNVFTPLFDLPCLKRLVIIVERNKVPSEYERDRLLKRAAHLEFFAIDTCAQCTYGDFDSCSRHQGG